MWVLGKLEVTRGKLEISNKGDYTSGILSFGEPILFSDCELELKSEGSSGTVIQGDLVVKNSEVSIEVNNPMYGTQTKAIKYNKKLIFDNSSVLLANRGYSVIGICDSTDNSELKLLNGSTMTVKYQGYGEGIFLNSSYSPDKIASFTIDDSTLEVYPGRSPALYFIKNAELKGNNYGKVIFHENSVVNSIENSIKDRDVLVTSEDYITVGSSSAPAAENAISEGIYIWDGSHFSNTTPLPTPLGIAQNLKWSNTVSGKAVWDSVSNADGYNVQLYKEGVALGNPVENLSVEEYDFTSAIQTAGEGSYTFRVQAVGDGVHWINAPWSLEAESYTYTLPTVPQIITETLPNAFLGESTYAQPLEAAGTSPIMWSRESGALPDGMDLSNTGGISGTPTKEGRFTFTVKAENAAGSDTKELSITVVPMPMPAYPIHISGGVANADFSVAGETVTITAAQAADEKRFKQWQITPTVTFVEGTDQTSQTAKFEMPAQEVNAVAVYEDIPTGTIAVTGITLNQKSVSLYSNTSPSSITLAASVAPTGATNKTVMWESSDERVATVDQSGKVSAVGNGTATITATTKDGGYSDTCTVSVTTYSSGGSGGGSKSGGTTQTTPTAGSNTVSGSTIHAVAKEEGKILNASIDSASISTALKKAAENKEGSVVNVIIDQKKGIDTIQGTIAKDGWKQIVQSDKTKLQVEAGSVTLTFDSKAVNGIAQQAQTDITIHAGLADKGKLTAAQQAAVGENEVYDLSVISGGKAISEFNGTVSVRLPYSLKAGETANSVIVSYLDSNGTLKIVKNAAYNGKTKTVDFSTSHFSLYMIGYHAQQFSDVSASFWGKSAIDFASARGLAEGTGNNKFNPNRAITRAEFAQMVFNAATFDGGDAAEFADVKADAWYYNAVMACKKAGLFEKLDIAENSFKPNQVITREEMAVVLSNAAKHYGVTASTQAVRDLTKFSDADSVNKSVTEEVVSAINLGLLDKNGAGNGTFAPKGSVTRAQAAQIQKNMMEVLGITE